MSDTDGVLAGTARVQAAAWKRLFDEYRAQRAAPLGEVYRPFEDADYLRYIDGRARTTAWPASSPPAASPCLGATRLTPRAGKPVCGLGNAKDRYLIAHLRERVADAFPTSVGFVRRLQSAGVRTAAVPASRT